MATILIPAALRSFTGGKSEIDVQGGTVGDAVRALAALYPDIAKHIYEDGGKEGAGKEDDNRKLRAFINVFVDETNIKKLSGLDTPVAATGTVMLVPAIAGGCGAAS